MIYRTVTAVVVVGLLVGCEDSKPSKPLPTVTRPPMRGWSLLPDGREVHHTTDVPRQGNDPSPIDRNASPPTFTTWIGVIGLGQERLTLNGREFMEIPKDSRIITIDERTETVTVQVDNSKPYQFRPFGVDERSITHADSAVRSPVD